MTATARFIVLWGTPNDPAAFDRHYRQVHVPSPGSCRVFGATPSAATLPPFAVAILITSSPSSTSTTWPPSKRRFNHPRVRQPQQTWPTWWRLAPRCRAWPANGKRPSIPFAGWYAAPSARDPDERLRAFGSTLYLLTRIEVQSHP